MRRARALGTEVCFAGGKESTLQIANSLLGHNEVHRERPRVEKGLYVYPHLTQVFPIMSTNLSSLPKPALDDYATGVHLWTKETKKKRKKP